MKYLSKTILTLTSIFCIIANLNVFANSKMSSDESKQFVKNAVIYALENTNPNMDYSKFVSKNFVNHIDGNKFNYEQWVTHQKNIKKIVKSMKPTFNLLIAEDNNVAAIYYIKIEKNDGSELEVKDMAFFKIKDHKIIYCEELTRLTQGNQLDKNIGSTK